MSKSRVSELQNLWTAILEDAVHAFPTLADEFERDLSRLQAAVVHRGIRVFLEDLPAIGKHFDRCLSAGKYSVSGLPLTGRISATVQIPKFLRGLYLLVFHSSNQLKEHPNVRAIFLVRELTLAFKKGKLNCSSEANGREVQSFYEVDSNLPEPEGFWSDARCSSDPALPNGIQTGSYDHAISDSIAPPSSEILEGGSDSAPCSSEQATEHDASRIISQTYQGFGKSKIFAERVLRCGTHLRAALSDVLARLDFVSSLVTATLGPYDPNAWRFSHGPGAVSEYRGPANKYCWTNWSDALESEYPIADHGFHNYGGWIDRLRSGEPISSQEIPSRLVCVPKTFSKPRLIAAEPSSKQWCQQNIWRYFDHQCARSWINDFVRFRDQSLNQRLCLIGSRTNTLATVDLSEASDRVTCHAVGQLFRGNPKLLRCLRASRSQSVSQSVTDKVPREIRLRKFSTMGNAVTFPVESLLFLCVALATTMACRKLRNTLESVESLRDEVAVFGDDIIVPVEVRELFVESLGVLYFKVNSQKSFWTGKFRESCGVDAFDGVEITPAYWRCFNDGKPEALASTVATRNNFYKKSLYTAADRLASTIPRRFAIPTVHMCSGVFGYLSELGPDITGFRTRWNQGLQRQEVLVHCDISSAQKLPIEDNSALLQYFTEDPAPDTNWRSGIPQRPRRLLRARWVAISDLGPTMRPVEI